VGFQGSLQTGPPSPSFSTSVPVSYMFGHEPCALPSHSHRGRGGPIDLGSQGRLSQRGGTERIRVRPGCTIGLVSIEPGQERHDGTSKQRLIVTHPREDMYMHNVMGG
jgi:hypothetical protein